MYISYAGKTHENGFKSVWALMWPWLGPATTYHTFSGSQVTMFHWAVGPIALAASLSRKLLAKTGTGHQQAHQFGHPQQHCTPHSLNWGQHNFDSMTHSCTPTLLTTRMPHSRTKPSAVGCSSIVRKCAARVPDNWASVHVGVTRSPFQSTSFGNTIYLP